MTQSLTTTSRINWAIYWFLFALTIVVFVFGVVVFFFSGFELRKRAEKAACRKGTVASCLEVGKYYEDKARGLIGFLMSNADSATTYYQKACALQSGPGCERMMFTFKNFDQARNLSVPLTDMADALIDGCASGVGGVCEQLDKFFDEGDWVAVRTVSKFEAHCEAGKSEACYRAGLMYQRNLGGRKNILEDVLALYEKGCAARIEASCKAAEPYRVEQAKRAAKKAADKP